MRDHVRATEASVRVLPESDVWTAAELCLQRRENCGAAAQLPFDMLNYDRKVPTFPLTSCSSIALLPFGPGYHHYWRAIVLDTLRPAGRAAMASSLHAHQLARRDYIAGGAELRATLL
jgi:hypothetical protein